VYTTTKMPFAAYQVPEILSGSHNQHQPSLCDNKGKSNIKQNTMA